MRPSRRPGRHSCEIDLCIDIPLPPAVVWDFLADIQDAEPIPRRSRVRMSKDPTGPTRAGTRWHESVRFAPGTWLHVESVVTQAVRPALLAMAFHCRWWSGELRYEITPTSRGCLLRHRETLTPAALLQPLAGSIGRRLRVRIQERLGDIRDLLLASRQQAVVRRPEG